MSDPRIGQTLYDTLNPSYMLSAVIAAISHERGPGIMPEHDALAEITRDRFSNAVITAMSYSPKRRQYQVAVRVGGSRPRNETMHLPQSAFRDAS